MAASGGPDDDTWKKMSPEARKAYWVCVVIVFGLIAGALLFKFWR
jgi:hypothetical protein